MFAHDHIDELRQLVDLWSCARIDPNLVILGSSSVVTFVAIPVSSRIVRILMTLKSFLFRPTLFLREEAVPPRVDRGLPQRRVQ